MFELHIKVDNIIKGKEVQVSKNTEIDEFITQLKKVEVTPRQERQNIIRKSQKWTLFQLDQEEPSKGKGKE